MDKQRIYGMDIDLDFVSDGMLEHIRDTLVKERDRAIGYLATIEFKLFQRSQNPLPFDDEYLEGYAEVGDLPPYGERFDVV